EQLRLDPWSPVAIVGVGMAGTLISDALTARGHSAVLLNRDRARLRFLDDTAALPAGVVLDQADAHAFARVILCSAAATPEYLDIGEQVIAEGGLLLLFAGTQPGMRRGGLDIDQLRRRQLTDTVAVGGRPIMLAGTYGATGDDFAEALALLA